MVTFEQLRISDDGQSLFIDAHVNKASCFDNVNLKSITICTEDQVSETDPLAYGEDYIYQEPVGSVVSSTDITYNEKKVWSGKEVQKHVNGYGGLTLELDRTGADHLDLVFSFVLGKYSGSGPTPVIPDTSELWVTAEDFSPYLGGTTFFTLTGEIKADKGYIYKVFRINKGNINPGNNSSTICLYLFSDHSMLSSLISLSTVEYPNFLHCIWQDYYTISTSSKKEVHLVLTANDFNEKFQHGNLSQNMFFVYIECEGTPDPCVPCRLDELTTLGVTFDYGLIFNQAMNYTRELADDCNIPSGFLDFILNFEALKLAIETEHYVPAIGFWKWITQNRSFGHGGYLPKPCGCHG